MKTTRVLLRGREATELLGEAIGKALRAGQGVALTGDLGAGKTTLARGLARGLAVDAPEEVRSPTYLLVVEHPGPIPLVHVDAYLPDKTRHFLEEGGFDYLAELRGVVVVEWADRVADLLPAETLWVELHPVELEDGVGRVAEVRWESAFEWVTSLPAELPAS